MRKALVLSLAALLCLGLAGSFAFAGEEAAAATEHKVVTVQGKVVCAKCALHEEGRTECQNVLIVNENGKDKQFYLTKNDAYNKLGEVCKGSQTVSVTGQVEKKDGHKWITASEIKPVTEQG
jgi:hypothetical protein